MGKLEDRVALVTGAGRGIGAAIAHKLALEGAAVVAADLDEAPLLEVVESIGAAGGQVVPLVGDVAAPDYGSRAIDTMLREFGGVDILVNNAGYIWNSTIQNMTDEQWYAMIDVHATAPFRLLRAATPFIRTAARREEGAGAPRHRKVINISSVSGTHGAATQLAYSAAKAAVVGLTKSLAKEWGRYRVNVNCVAFGYITTRLTQESPGGDATIDIHGRQLRVGFTPEVRNALPAAISLGRSGTVAEAAGAVYLLCLPESDFITGQVLECSGGQAG